MAQIADLSVRISAQIAEFQKSFADASKTVDQFAGEFEGAATRASAVGNFIGNIAADMAKSFAGAVTGIAKDSIRLSQEFNNAFIGLGSVAAAFGQDVTKAKEAAKGLSADGLLPLKDSATSLKNLLASGFGLDQSVKLINAFKDSAAFGRQSALSFGDAVRSATEGVKNGNSILVDNAGVTKNLSVILGEAGFKMQDLSDKTKGAAARQALFNGILRETAAQAGDAGKAANTYTGQVTALSTAYDTLLATIGDTVTQNKTVADAIGAVGGVLRDVTSAASDNRKAFLLVSDGVIFVVRSFATLVGAINTVQSGFASLQVASNTFFSSFADLGIAIFKFQEKAAGIAQFLDPVNAKRHAAAIIEARDAYTFLEGAVRGFDAASTDAEVRQAGLTKALSGLQEKANTLAVELAKTRGQVVELGKAGGESGGPIAAIGAGAAASGEKLKGFAGQLKKLTDDIERAQKSGKELPELMTRFGSAASKSVTEAADWGIKVSASVRDVSSAFRQAALDKTLDKLGDGFEKFFSARAQNQFKKLQAEMHETAVAMLELPKTLEKLDDGFDKFFAGISGDRFKRLQQGMHEAVPQIIAELSNPFKKAFASLGQELPELLQRGFQQSSLGGGLAVIAGGASTQFASVFRDGLKRVADDTTGQAKLTGKEIGAGIAAGALESFATGFANGMQGNSTGGFLSSAIGGIVTGFTLGGPAGAFVGLGAGLAGYLIGVADAADAEAAQVAQSQTALLTQFHGLENLRKQMERASFDFNRRGADPLTATTAQEFNGRIALMNQALDAYNEKLKAISASSDAVNKRTAAFGKQFEPLVTAKKTATEGGDTGAAAAAGQQIKELAQRTQPEFERISLFVRDTFAAIVRETGDAIGAINQLAPSFAILKAGISDFGLTSSTVIDSLVGIFDTVNNEAFKPFFENIQASGQLLKGLFDANVLSPDTFQAAAADIGQSIQEIINRGGDMAQALALSAPQLQTLWEAQQRYGTITDQTTQSILHQAEEQGIVGEQFRDVNERILDVLVAIGEALGATIPDGLRAIPRAAAQAGAGITDAFGGAFDNVDDRIRTASTNLGGSFANPSRSAGQSITANVGGALDGLSAKARTAATGVSNALNAIKPPNITIPVNYEFNASTDPRVRFFLDPNDQRFPPGTIPFVPEPRGDEGGATTVVLRVNEDELGRVVLPAIAREALNLGLVPR